MGKNLIITLLVVVSAGMFLLNKSTNKINDEIKNEKYQLTLKLSASEAAYQEVKKYNAFTKALDEIGSIPWTPGNNCYDHSKALQEKLALDGIQSSIFINKDRSHAWLGVWVEATTGHFLPPTSPYKIVEVRDGSLNVVCTKK
ncbi:MAG: hypothetical protein NTZ18_03805 [Candidatus Komeilibacteria bacterium]|nr:hypothetical protein [Candidatus Komeilibacteria bacterium]